MSNRSIERHNFDLGDIVTVFNRTLGGKFIIEGRAQIVKVRESEDQYEVRFVDEDGRRSAFGTRHLRYVDPNGQEDPEKYLKTLNDWSVVDTSHN